MIKTFIKFLANKMSCASIFGAQGINVLSNSFLLESAGAELTDAGVSTASVLGALLDFIANIINTWVYIIAKYILLFVDFCQMITYKIAGIDNDLENIVDLPIFKFLLNDNILKTIGAIIILGLILLVLISIIAIIKSEYEASKEDKKDAKSSAYKVLGKASIALFTMVITPFIIVIAIIFSSVMLTSVNNVLNSNDSEQATLGGTIFKTAAYNANSYRIYAADGKRVPIILNFDDPYEDGTYVYYTPEQLKEIYDGWNGKEIYNNFATGKHLDFNKSLTYKNGKIYNSNSYLDYESFISTQEQYYVMADFIDYAISHDITFYIKDSKDNQIDWNRTSSDIKITDGVYDPYKGTISITYKDLSNLSPYEDYYTITFEPSAASASTPIVDAVSTISLLLGLNTIVNGGSASKTNSSLTVGPVNMIQSNTSLQGVAGKIEDTLQNLNSTINRSENSGIKFRILERVEGSQNVVKWKTHKAIYNGREYTVYQLKKVFKNTQTGINEVKATVNVAKKDDSLNSKYYIVSEDVNSLGYYDYTNVTIDYYNDGGIYLDTLTPLYKWVTWPEKLYNDLSVIYSDIDFDGLIAYDNWSDALGTYFKTSNNVVDKDVSSFATTLIHPLGLIMSELFLGTTIEGGNGNTSSFSFASAYYEDMINSITLSVGGEFNYNSISYQIENFMRLFNAQFASVIEDLMELENFDLYGNNDNSVNGYVYKAYLASIMLSDDYSNYLQEIANTLLTSEKLIELMSLGANSVTYDENGNPVYKINYITGADGQYVKLFYDGEEDSAKAVYNSNGKMVYTARENGKLSPIGKYVPKAGTLYEIREESAGWGMFYYFYNSVTETYVRASALCSDEEYEKLSKEEQSTALKFSDCFETYYEKADNYVYVYEPSDGDTSKATTQVIKKLLIISDDDTEITKALNNYYLYETEKVLDIDSSYLTYDELPKVYQNFFDNLIKTIENDAKEGLFSEPMYLEFLREYKANDISMKDIMNAESISASTAKKYLENYEDMQEMVDRYTEILNSAVDSGDRLSASLIVANNQNKINQLKKYYIIYGISSFASTQVSSGFNVVVNGHPFFVSQGIVQRELLEIIYGNKLTFSSVINKIKNGTAYNYLEDFDKLSFAQLSAFASLYIARVDRITSGSVRTAELFGGKLTDSELDIINKVYTLSTGFVKDFTNQSLKRLEEKDKEDVLRELQSILNATKYLIENYTSGKTINSVPSYLITVDEAYAILGAFLEFGAEGNELHFVEQDYTGIIGDDLKGFNSLKSFLTDFGDLCFELARETSLGQIGQFESENILNYTSDLLEILLDRLNALDLGDEFDKFEIIKNSKVLKDIIGRDVANDTKFILLDAKSKEYIYRLYEIYDQELIKYQAQLDASLNARDYAIRYIAGRYAMQSDSYIFETGLKNYLEFFRYNTDIDSAMFEEDFVYDSYLGSLSEYQDRLYYYNLYLESFDNITLGTNGLYFESLTDLQQKVVMDMANYYSELYTEFTSTTNEQYSQLLYNKTLLYNFIFKHKDYGARLANNEYARPIADTATVADLFNSASNISLLNLCNLLDYVGIEYSQDKTLSDYRLDAINMLITFTERAGESGASIQARYLTLLNLACATYSTNTMGEKTILIDASTKTSILKLAGLENKAEENLVGLEYEINNSDSISDEKYGSVFIICTYNAETDMYEPFVFATDSDSVGTPKTSYYSSANEKTAYYPVIAKGVIGTDGLPTAIREVNGYIEFYRESVIIADAGALGIDMYYMTTEDIALNYNPINVVVNTISTWISGKSLAQQLMDAVPVIVSSKNLNFAYGTKTSYAYHLQNGEFTLNYMFYPETGISMPYLYKVSQLNTLVLVLGTLILAISIAHAMFGVIRNLYELLIVVIIYPGALAMYPLDDGVQKNWRKEFIDKLLIMLGYIMAINGFFLILNLLQRMEITLVLTPESVSELKNTFLFGLFSVESIIANLMTFMLFIVACTLLKTLPDFFARIAGVSKDLTERGKSALNESRINLEEATYFSSGYAVEDMVLSKIDKLRELPLVGDYARQKKKEKRQEVANKRAVEAYRKRLKDTGKQKLIQENLNKYRNRLVRRGGYSTAKINQMVDNYEKAMQKMDFESLVKSSVAAYKNRLTRYGLTTAQIDSAVAAYEERIRQLQISSGAIDKATSAYEASLARQLEAEHNRKFNEKEARDARIAARVKRLQAKQAAITKEHYQDKKKKPKFCSRCGAKLTGKSKGVCPVCKNPIK